MEGIVAICATQQWSRIVIPCVLTLRIVVPCVLTLRIVVPYILTLKIIVPMQKARYITHHRMPGTGWKHCNCTDDTKISVVKLVRPDQNHQSSNSLRFFTCNKKFESEEKTRFVILVRADQFYHRNFSPEDQNYHKNRQFDTSYHCCTHLGIAKIQRLFPILLAKSNTEFKVCVRHTFSLILQKNPIGFGQLCAVVSRPII